VYALQSGSFLVDVPLPKSPYNNVTMAIDFDIINFVGNYIMINELKSPCEKKPFKKVL
jgi:hypothetical protein